MNLYSEEARAKRWRGTLNFLHDKGYSFFSIPRLTFAEVESLVTENNEQVNKEKVMARRYKHG